jgi:hypothetical protein
MADQGRLQCHDRPTFGQGPCHALRDVYHTHSSLERACLWLGEARRLGLAARSLCVIIPPGLIRKP